jgi:hypothetical protein
LNPIQLPFEPVELGSELGDRSEVTPLVAIEGPEDLPTAMDDHLVLDSSDLVEEGGELLIGHGLDAIDAEQRRVTADRLDLLDQPLEEFGCLGRLGQNPAGGP